MIFYVNPTNPQLRLIRKAVELLNEGEVLAWPTDTVYGLGCNLNDKRAIERLYQIKRVDKG
ncbi:MAG: Sua5/YciO/YrdC/YwlC family protein, partial [bacterium]